MSESFKKLLGSLLIFLLLVVLSAEGAWVLEKVGLTLAHPFNLWAHYVLGIGLWMVGALVTVRLMAMFFWERFMAPRLGGHVPKLLKDVVAVILFLLAVIGIVGTVFRLPITGLLATSGAMGLVVGLAIKSIIADLFTGIAFNVDRPFLVGEWLTLHERGLEPITGQVVEVSWRSTQIKKTDGVLVVVPNGRMGLAILTNLSRPKVESRFKLKFSLDFDVPTERALRILEAALKSAPGVLDKPMAKVRVNGTSQRGMEYELRYWLDPVKTSPSKGRNNISIAVLDHMHQAGLKLAFPKQDIYMARMPKRHFESAVDCQRLLERVDLFETLQPQEFENLAAGIQQRSFKAYETIVEENQEDQSMYILVEGLLEVHATSDDGTEVKIGILTPGQFFGEMSLLTGEPRSATVRAATNTLAYEITKDDLLPLLEQRPKLAEDMAAAMADRQVAAHDAQEKHLRETQIIHSREGLTKSLLGKVRGLFRLES